MLSLLLQFRGRRLRTKDEPITFRPFRISLSFGRRTSRGSPVGGAAGFESKRVRYDNSFSGKEEKTILFLSPLTDSCCAECDRVKSIIIPKSTRESFCVSETRLPQNVFGNPLGTTIANASRRRQRTIVIINLDAKSGHVKISFGW